MAQRSPVTDRIHLAGEVAWEELPAHYAAGDVFAMPGRTRWLGLGLEALGGGGAAAAGARGPPGGPPRGGPGAWGGRGGAGWGPSSPGRGWSPASRSCW